MDSRWLAWGVVGVLQEVAVQLARRQSDAALEMARSGRARARSSQARVSCDPTHTHQPPLC
jgi:hypothetical protein